MILAWWNTGSRTRDEAPLRVWSKPIAIGGWRLQASLIPLPDHLRGRSQAKTIGFGPAGSSSRRDRTRPAVDKLQKKYAHERTTDLEAPLRVSVKVRSPAFSFHQDETLTHFDRPASAPSHAKGSPSPGTRLQSDAVWMSRDGRTQLHNLHGAWFFHGLPPSTPLPIWQSCLALNPHVDAEIPEALLRVPRLQADADGMVEASVENLDE